ncbi:MAG: hypothetical protein CR982_03580 [Candidatus Cloacimonadota bacterium]|nr:MAG: hypothetical protein CR982_03580 [Candidatus Cloacimonadota bacterium]PIE78307.1 MAG: hypothetical protein CSA15_08425 [Candidatus Delongbacteria bacterium]
MKKKIFIYIALSIVLAFFIYKSDFDFSLLLDITVPQFLGLSTLSILGFFIGSLYFYTGFKIFGVKESFKNYFYYTVASYFLNYLPLKINLIFLGDFLRRKHGLGIKKYSVVILLNYLLIVSSAILLAFYLLLFDDISIFLSYFIDLKSKLPTVWIVLSLILTIFLIILFVLKKKDRLNFFNLFEFYSLLKRNLVSILYLKLYVLLQILIFSGRLYIVFLSLGIDISFNQALFFGLISNFSFLFNFTPGGIGVKESLLGSLTYITMGNFEVGVVASLLDRTINFLWVLIFGSFSLKTQLKEYVDEC